MISALTVSQMVLFSAAPERPPSPYKICHVYPTMMKLSTVMPYLKKIPKMYGSRDSLLEFC